MKRFVIQSKAYPPWHNKWETIPTMQFDTLEEAREAFNKLPFKADHRIAETYTIVRYKPVKPERLT